MKRKYKNVLRTVVVLAVVLALTFGLCACGDKDKVTKQDPIVILATVNSTMGDQGVNDDGWIGCEKVADKKDVDIRCLESASKQQLNDSLMSAGMDEAVLAVAMGPGGERAAQRAAEKYPKTNYLVMDGTVSGENLGSLNFHEEEAGFLAGVAAAGTTKTNVVGFIGLKNNVTSQRYQYGFLAGVKTINSDIIVLQTNVSSSADVKDVEKAAENMSSSEADIIMQAAGSAGASFISEKGNPDYMFIGTEIDQSKLNSANVLCSAVKDTSSAVFDNCVNAIKGKFKGEIEDYNLKNKGVSLSDKAGNMTVEVKESVEKWQKAIEKEEFAVPSTQSEYNSFEVPTL